MAAGCGWASHKLDAVVDEDKRRMQPQQEAVSNVCGWNQHLVTGAAGKNRAR